MDYQAIIDRYYPSDDDLRQLLMKHSRQVADRCLSISDHHPELPVDRQFLEEAAMLHDIGVRWCDAPAIFCHGTEPYIRHGVIGAALLRKEGWERHARVCERHTGTGITRQQILEQQLPLTLPPLPTDGEQQPYEGASPYPAGTITSPYEPVTLEEQLVCYADKFYSKSKPDRQFSVAEVAEGLERFGHDGVERFLGWATMFE